MAISFDEWRSARREGKQAVDTPDFATWRMERDKRKQVTVDLDYLSGTNLASGQGEWWGK